MENNIKKDKETKDTKNKIPAVCDIVGILNSIAPLELQDEWDNSGLQLGFNEKPIKKIITCMEINDDVVNEATEAEADMIITHHPLIFGGIDRIQSDNPQGERIIELISNNISVYSCHTPFDKVNGGNNDIIARFLGLTAVKNLKGEDVVSPSKMIEKKDEADMGRMGKFKKPLNYMQVIDIVSSKLNVSLRQMNAVGRLDTEISTVGICAGAGAEFFEMAAASGCELFITGDVKYHQAVRAKELGVCLLDVGHHGTEKFFGEVMKEKLLKKLDGKVEIIASQNVVNPFEIL